MSVSGEEREERGERREEREVSPVFGLQHRLLVRPGGTGGAEWREIGQPAAKL